MAHSPFPWKSSWPESARFRLKKAAKTIATANVEQKKQTSAITIGKPQLHAQIKQRLAADELVKQTPFNAQKASEYGVANALSPVESAHHAPTDDVATAGTLSESEAGAKIGEGVPQISAPPLSASLDRARTGAAGQTLTTNMGVAIGANQGSLKVCAAPRCSKISSFVRSSHTLITNAFRGESFTREAQRHMDSSSATNHSGNTPKPRRSIRPANRRPFLFASRR